MIYVVTRQLKKWFDGFCINKLTIRIKPHPQTEFLCAVQAPPRIVLRRKSAACVEKNNDFLPVYGDPKPARIRTRRNTTAVEMAIDLTTKSRSTDINLPPIQNANLAEKPRVEEALMIGRIQQRQSMTGNEEVLDLSIKSGDEELVTMENTTEDTDFGCQSACSNTTKTKEYVPRTLFFGLDLTHQSTSCKEIDENTNPAENETFGENSTVTSKATDRTQIRSKRNSIGSLAEIDSSNQNTMQLHQNEKRQLKQPVPSLIPLNVPQRNSTTHKCVSQTSTPNLATHPMEYAKYVEKLLDKSNHDGK